jgi:hypothetical protein
VAILANSNLCSQEGYITKRPTQAHGSGGDNREASVPAGIMIESGSWSTPGPRAGVSQPADVTSSAGAAASNHQ